MEGPDLSGKTTASVRLGAEFGFPVIKPWADLSSPRPSLTSVSRTLQSVAHAFSSHLIFDRFLTSEYIYGQVLGRDVLYLDDLIAEWREVAPLCVLHCNLSQADLETRFMQRGDHLFDLAKLLAIRRAYDQLPEYLPDWIEYARCNDLIGMRSAITARV